jgi:hypothetical protein
MTLRETNPALADQLEIMLGELQSERLDVVLVPAPSPRHSMHKVRVVAGRNPSWYRAHCARWPSSRRRLKTSSDTRIRRGDTVRTLEAMLGEGSASVYAPYFLRVATRRLFSTSKA